MRYVCICLLLIPALTFADDLIPEHGKYSEAYQSDWANMPDGRELARHDPAGVNFVDVKGEDARQTFIGEEEVRLSGERLRVTWDSPECGKYKHTLYFFQKCERVVIEDMWIIQNHADWRSSSTFFFESCGTVEMRECYVQGSWGKSAIRIEGCREYFIDGVELCGIDSDEGFRCGQGIFINNGAGLQEDGRQRSVYAPDPYDLEWGVIQNCWFHDYEPTPEFINHDGILLQAPADGIIFNCYFEDWEGDSAIDDSHRRDDADYQNHLHRIERCVFEKCHRIKTNGASGSPSCALLWCNNLYIDSSLTDYATGILPCDGLPRGKSPPAQLPHVMPGEDALHVRDDGQGREFGHLDDGPRLVHVFRAGGGHVAACARRRERGVRDLGAVAGGGL